MRLIRNTSSSGGIVDMILKIAPIVCSFFAFLFLAIALSSGMKENYLESLSIINVSSSLDGDRPLTE